MLVSSTVNIGVALRYCWQNSHNRLVAIFVDRFTDHTVQIPEPIY